MSEIAVYIDQHPTYCCGCGILNIDKNNFKKSFEAYIKKFKSANKKRKKTLRMVEFILLNHQIDLYHKKILNIGGKCIHEFNINDKKTNIYLIPLYARYI